MVAKGQTLLFSKKNVLIKTKKQHKIHLIIVCKKTAKPSDAIRHKTGFKVDKQIKSHEVQINVRKQDV